MTKSKKREIDKTKKKTLYQHEIVGASDREKMTILKVPVLQSLESLKKLAVIRNPNPVNNNSLTDLIQEKYPVAETRAESSARDGIMTNIQENAKGKKNSNLGQKISTLTSAAKLTNTKKSAPAKNNLRTEGAAVKKNGAKGELQNTLDNFVLNTPSFTASTKNQESQAAEEVEATKKRVEVFRNDIFASSANAHHPEDIINDALKRKIEEIETTFKSNFRSYKMKQNAQICQLEASNEKLKEELYTLKEKHGAEAVKFQETLEEEKKRNEVTSASLERLKNLVTPMSNKLKEFKDKNDNLIKVNNSLKSKVEESTSDLSEERIKNLESEVVNWKTKYETNAKELDTFKDTSALEVQKAVEEIEEEVTLLKEENSRLNGKLDDVRKEQKSEVSRLTEENYKHLAEKAELKSTLVDFKKIKDENELLTKQLNDLTEKINVNQKIQLDQKNLSRQLSEQSRKFQDEKKWLQATLRQQGEEITKLKKAVAAKEPSPTVATSSKRKRSASSENPDKKSKLEESKQLCVSFSSSSTAEGDSIDDLLEDSLEIDTTVAESMDADTNEETDPEDTEAVATKATQPCSNLLANIEKFTLASSRGGEVAPDPPSLRKPSDPSNTPVASSPITRKVTNPGEVREEGFERQVSKPISSTLLQLQRKKRLADLFGDDEDEDAADEGLSPMPEVESPGLGKAGETLLIEETDPPLNVSYSPAKTSQVEQPHVTKEKRGIKVRDLQEVLGSKSDEEKSELPETNFEEEVDLAAIAKHAGKLEADVTDVVKRCLKRFSQSGNEILSSEQFEHLAREFSQDFKNVIMTKYLEVHENLHGIEIKNEDKTSIIDNIIFFFAVKDAVRKHTTAEAAGRKNMLRINPQKFIQELTKEFYIKIRDGSTAYKEAGGSLNLTDDLQQQILNNIRFKMDMLIKK